MLSPGAKGWITKYFDLDDRGDIALKYKKPKSISDVEYMRLTFAGTGLVYGYPVQLIFAKKLDTSKWTQEEHLKLLLFEAHLLSYLIATKGTTFKKEAFLAALFNFYRFHKVRS